ncbi:MAG: iron hydrogenase small subunit [Spirochaetota bacterium]
MAGLYKDDQNSEVRASHQNPEIKQLYDDFIEMPLSEVSHKYFRTNYTPRPLYKNIGAV